MPSLRSFIAKTRKEAIESMFDRKCFTGATEQWVHTMKTCGQRIERSLKHAQRWNKHREASAHAPGRSEIQEGSPSAGAASVPAAKASIAARDQRAAASPGSGRTRSEGSHAEGLPLAARHPRVASNCAPRRWAKPICRRGPRAKRYAMAELPRCSSRHLSRIAGQACDARRTMITIRQVVFPAVRENAHGVLSHLAPIRGLQTLATSGLPAVEFSLPDFLKGIKTKFWFLPEEWDCSLSPTS